MISGYLIPASYASDPASYFPKRALRIYPGFIVASLLCIFVVAPVGGAALRELSVVDWAKLAVNTLMLKAPSVPGAFDELPEPALNGSLWTISYEFRCYILAAAFGFIGLYLRPRLFALLTALMLAVNVLFAVPQPAAVLTLPGPIAAVVGEPKLMVRLLSAFMTGTCFWLLKPTISGRIALVAASSCRRSCSSRGLQTIAVSLLGGYAPVLAGVPVRVAAASADQRQERHLLRRLPLRLSDHPAADPLLARHQHRGADVGDIPAVTDLRLAQLAIGGEAGAGHEAAAGTPEETP